jgi:hypothetical protein
MLELERHFFFIVASQSLIGFAGDFKIEQFIVDYFYIYRFIPGGFIGIP